MPEGPEIRRAADRVARALVGHRAERVFFAFDRLKPYERKLRGRTVDAIDTRGKAMLTRFSGALVVYSHNQLYGRWTVTRAGREPSTRRSVRLAIHNERHSAWLLSASEIDVVPEQERDRHPFLAKLGPDALARGLTDAALVARLRNRRFARRQRGALLLDQGFVAGLGNYLRSEILFVAGLHPSLRPTDLDDAEAGALAAAVRGVTRRAYRTGGITNDPRRVEAQRARGLTRRELRHHVFARGGRRCYACGRRIERLVVSSRKLFRCPGCQPKGRRAGRRSRTDPGR